MNLGALIKLLEALPEDMTFHVGIGEPMSYRGYYEQLAFEPEYDISVADMLVNARSALGGTFTGYKGGDYVMDEGTPVWLASYGSTGNAIDGLGFALGAEW